MKRTILAILIIVLSLQFAAAVSGEPDRFRVVQFTPDAFARAGFSNNPVVSTVEPDGNASTPISLALSGNNITSEKAAYAYCQIFTKLPVQIRVSGTALDLRNSSNVVTNSYSWKAEFKGYDGLIKNESVTLSSGSEATILNETQYSADIDFGYPRHYCWSVMVTLDNDSNGEAKKQPAGNTTPITGKITLEIITE